MKAEIETKPVGISVGVVIMCLQEGLAVRVSHQFYGKPPPEYVSKEKEKNESS